MPAIFYNPPKLFFESKNRRYRWPLQSIDIARLGQRGHFVSDHIFQPRRQGWLVSGAEDRYWRLGLVVIAACLSESSGRFTTLFARLPDQPINMTLYNRPCRLKVKLPPRRRRAIETTVEGLPLPDVQPQTGLYINGEFVGHVVSWQPQPLPPLQPEPVEEVTTDALRALLAAAGDGAASPRFTSEGGYSLN